MCKPQTNPFASPTVHRYSLTLAGLWVLYTAPDGTHVNARIEPRPLCALMKRLELIEGMDEDTNREPVILYSKEHVDADGYSEYVTGACEWKDFVRTYPLKEIEVEAIVSLNEENKWITGFQTALAI